MPPPDGGPLCVVAEVHNTYGGRHGYLLRPDENDRATAAKEFYVSPFFPVDGGYRMRLPEPGAALDLTVHLERDGGRPFTATVRGVRRRATPAPWCGSPSATRCPPRRLRRDPPARHPALPARAPRTAPPPHRTQEGMQ